MRTGGLRHIVTVDQPVASQNDTGEEVIDWTPYRKAFAAIEPIRGREFALLGGIDSSTDTRLRLRWTPGLASIGPKWRIRHHGNFYDVQSVIDVDTLHREIWVMCKSGLTDG